MFLSESDFSQEAVRVLAAAGLVILVMVLGTFVLGLFPSPLMLRASEVGVF